MTRSTLSAESRGVGDTFETALARNRRWYRAQGILFLVAGMLALLAPGAAVVGLDIFLAALLIVSGGYQGYQGAIDRSGWLIVSGLLSLIVGLIMIVIPLVGAIALATLIAVFLVVEGIIEVVFSLQIRSSANWKWLFVSGILSVLLGGLLLIGWPAQTLALAGILLGINFLFYGASVLAIAYKKPV